MTGAAAAQSYLAREGVTGFHCRRARLKHASYCFLVKVERRSAMNALSDASDAQPLVLLRIAKGVAFLTLNRPRQYNALSEQMLAALHGTLEAIAGDASVRVVVLGGAGKAFCAGHDLKQMKANPSLEYYQRLFDDCSRLMMRIQTMPQPVIARVHGIATAAGCQLVATCDLAIAADDTRFAVSGVNIGLFCATPSVALTRNLGRKAAFEMLVTGESIDAAAAVKRGLINHCVAADCLDMEITKLAAAIVAKPPSVIAMGKALFYRQIELGTAPAYQLAAQSMACNMMDDIAQEGASAFIAKRAPAWARNEI
jgi:enoyl-CoA hydratase/carnithine racemase